VWGILTKAFTHYYYWCAILLQLSGVPRGERRGETPRTAFPKGAAAVEKGVEKNACKIGVCRCKNENLKVNDNIIMESSDKGVAVSRKTSS